MKYMLAILVTAFLYSCSSADHGLHSGTSCAKKKRDYAKHGINGQKAMVGF